MLKYVVLCVQICAVFSVQWDHSIYLNDDFRLLWTVQSQDVTFEVQVRTLGYVGLGFSRDGSRSGADIAIGWIDHGQTFFQVRKAPKYFRPKNLYIIIAYRCSVSNDLTIFRFHFLLSSAPGRK